MIERFEDLLDPDGQGTLEKLDRGIFLEVISKEISPEAESEPVDYIYGSFCPESNPWEVLYYQAVEAGAIQNDGGIVWDALVRCCAEHGGEPESLQELTLSDLANMLEKGVKLVL